MGELVAGTASSGGGVGWRGVAAHQRLLMMLQSVKEADLAAFFIARGRQIGACFAAFCVAGAGGGQGEGQGGETGAKGHVFQKKSKKHTNKKSLPTSRIRPPWGRKTDLLFFIASRSRRGRSPARGRRGRPCQPSQAQNRPSILANSAPASCPKGPETIVALRLDFCKALGPACTCGLGR